VGYDMIMLTGGEPMLYPDRLKSIIREIRRKTKTPIILYTAETTNIEELSDIVRCIDGVTVTLHQPSDFDDFLRFDHYHTNEFGSPRSYRLNIFKGVNLDTGEVKGRWKIKANIDWISKAPLPEGETLMRYNSQSE
jgi:organic radical activating enzyme